MNEPVIKALGAVGQRKMLIWAWTFGLVAAFTMVRMLLPLFVEGMAPLDDIPTVGKELLVWVSGSVALANMGAKFAPAVKQGVEKS